MDRARTRRTLPPSREVVIKTFLPCVPTVRSASRSRRFSRKAGLDNFFPGLSCLLPCPFCVGFAEVRTVVLRYNDHTL